METVQRSVAARTTSKWRKEDEQMEHGGFLGHSNYIVRYCMEDMSLYIYLKQKAKKWINYVL